MKLWSQAFRSTAQSIHRFLFILTITPRRCSLVVDTEDNTRAEEGVVLVSEGGPVIILIVPEALGSDSHTLSCDLSNDGLNNDLVGRDVQGFNLQLYLVCDGLRHQLSSPMIVILILEVSQDDLLNAWLNLGWVESVWVTLNIWNYLSCSRGSNL